MQIKETMFFVDFVFNGLIAIGTVVLAYATWSLAKSTYRLAIETRDTAKNQQRAYLVATPELNISKEHGGNLVAATLVLENAGQTPAHVMQAVLTSRFDASEDTPSFTFEPGSQQVVSVTIPPGRSERLGTSGNWIEEGFGPVLSGEKQHLIGIRVTYVDVFKDTHVIERGYILRQNISTKEMELAALGSPFSYT